MMKLIKSIDILSNPPTIIFNSSSTYKNYLGSALSFIIFALIIVLGNWYLALLINQTEFKIIFSKTKNLSSQLTLSNHNYNFMFTLIDDKNLVIENWSQYFKINIHHKQTLNNSDSSLISIPFGDCLYNKDISYISEKKYLCINLSKEISLINKEVQNSIKLLQIQLTVSKCQNSTNNFQCSSNDSIDKMLSSSKILLRFLEVNFDHFSPDQPENFYYREYTRSLMTIKGMFSELSTEDDIFLKNTKYISDSNFIYSNKINFDYIQIDSYLTNYIAKDKNDLTHYSLKLNIHKDSFDDVYQRTYMKLPSVLSYLVGVFFFLYIIFKVFVKIYLSKMYFKYILKDVGINFEKMKFKKEYIDRKLLKYNKRLNSSFTKEKLFLNESYANKFNNDSVIIERNESGSILSINNTIKNEISKFIPKNVISFKNNHILLQNNSIKNEEIERTLKVKETQNSENSFFKSKNILLTEIDKNNTNLHQNVNNDKILLKNNNFLNFNLKEKENEYEKTNTKHVTKIIDNVKANIFFHSERDDIKDFLIISNLLKKKLKINFCKFISCCFKQNSEVSYFYNYLEKKIKKSLQIKKLLKLFNEHDLILNYLFSSNQIPFFKLMSTLKFLTSGLYKPDDEIVPEINKLISIFVGFINDTKITKDENNLKLVSLFNEIKQNIYKVKKGFYIKDILDKEVELVYDNKI